MSGHATSGYVLVVSRHSALQFLRGGRSAQISSRPMGRALRSDYLICYVYLQVRFSSYSRDGHSSFGATVADDRLIALGDRVGGLREDDSPATMAFPIEEQIAYLSTFCTLEPGDFILTGTPTGAGARFDPPRYLVPGDVVEDDVPGIGTVRNGVRDE